MERALGGYHPVLHELACRCLAARGQQALLCHEATGFLGADIIPLEHQHACGLLVSVVSIRVVLQDAYVRDHLCIRHLDHAPPAQLGRTAGRRPTARPLLWLVIMLVPGNTCDGKGGLALHSLCDELPDQFVLLAQGYFFFSSSSFSWLSSC